MAAWHWVGRVLCFVWREKHFISIQHEKEKFALGHKEAIVQFLISLGEKGDEGEKKSFPLGEKGDCALVDFSWRQIRQRREKKIVRLYELGVSFPQILFLFGIIVGENLIGSSSVN